MTASRRYRTAGRLVLIASAVVAVILVLHIVLVLLNANPDNALASTDTSWAGTIAHWFVDLFRPSSYKLGVVINYGIATLVWLAAGRAVASVLNRL
jgi:hypothetical protein